MGNNNSNKQQENVPGPEQVAKGSTAERVPVKELIDKLARTQQLLAKTYKAFQYQNKDYVDREVETELADLKL